MPWPPDPTPGPRVGYVLKMYPRFSETFVVSEILAHERAGADIEIFSLRRPDDGRFHEMLADVRAPVTYLPEGTTRAERLWRDLATAAEVLPGLFGVLEDSNAEDAADVHQAVLLATEVRERGIEHLHAHFGSIATTVARMTARLAGVSYSFTAHAKDIFHEEVCEEDLRRKLEDAAAVVTVSEYNRAHLVELCPSAAGRVHRVYNGLDLRRFPYAEPDARAPVIVGVGRLVEKKGWPDLVRACGLLVREGRDVRCRIVGAGPVEDDLRRQISDLGLERHVELLGPRSQDAVRAIVAEAAVFAAPCVVGADGNRDGLPTVLLEAMALGTPCVATPVTGIPEAVEDGRTGVLVPERDPVALAHAVGVLLDDAPLRVRLARAARARIEERFDGDRSAELVRELALSPALAAG